MSKFKVGDIVKVVDSPNDIQGMRIRKGKIDIIQNIVDVDGMQVYILTGDEYCFLWNENQLKLLGTHELRFQKTPHERLIELVEIVEHALEQAKKQEKLLGLYKELMTAKDELLSIGWFGVEYYETVKKEIGLEKQIKELEDESK